MAQRLLRHLSALDCAPIAVIGALRMSFLQEVLSEQISDAIGNRDVSSAVFTTYSFDPGFFELHILPLLFPNVNFSEAEKVRLLQLEDNLRSLRHFAVYFDSNAIAYDAAPPRFGYSRIDVRWKKGCFHPKLIFLLVDEPNPGEYQTLIVCCLSANLTQAGWWENVECVHIEEIRDRAMSDESCSLRSDLMAVIQRIRRALPYEQHDALETVHCFLRDRVDQLRRESSNQKRSVRVFGGTGGKKFSQWIVDESLVPKGWNLEVVSPYFNTHNIQPLTDLIDAVNPKQTRIYLPQAADGTVLVSPTVYDEVKKLHNVRWARIPSSYITRKSSKNTSDEKIAPRFVHAKIYRFWRRQEGDCAVVGSVNCTTPAHSRPEQGNLEVALFLDLAGMGTLKRWWLELEDEDFEHFDENVPDELEGYHKALFDVFVQYDWVRHEVAVRLEKSNRVYFPIDVTSLNGRLLFTIEKYVGEGFQTCNKAASDRVRDALEESSFLKINCKEYEWRILIRETSCSHRPSILRTLTPEEILKYWSLLSPEQRAVFLERHVPDWIEGLPSSNSKPDRFVNSVFSEFSGIFSCVWSLTKTHSPVYGGQT